MRKNIKALHVKNVFGVEDDSLGSDWVEVWHLRNAKIDELVKTGNALRAILKARINV